MARLIAVFKRREADVHARVGLVIEDAVEVVAVVVHLGEQDDFRAARRLQPDIQGGHVVALDTQIHIDILDEQRTGHGKRGTYAAAGLQGLRHIRAGITDARQFAFALAFTLAGHGGEAESPAAQDVRRARRGSRRVFDLQGPRARHAFARQRRQREHRLKMARERRVGVRDVNGRLIVENGVHEVRAVHRLAEQVHGGSAGRSHADQQLARVLVPDVEVDVHVAHRAGLAHHERVLRHIHVGDDRIRRGAVVGPAHLRNVEVRRGRRGGAVGDCGRGHQEPAGEGHQSGIEDPVAAPVRHGGAQELHGLKIRVGEDFHNGVRGRRAANDRAGLRDIGIRGSIRHEQRRRAGILNGVPADGVPRGTRPLHTNPVVAAVRNPVRCAARTTADHVVCR